MKLPFKKTEGNKSLFVQILQWLYLVIAVVALVFIFSFDKVKFITSLGFPNLLFFGLGLAIVVYALILSFSLFTQNTNLLILALVLIFFTTIGALLMLGVAIPNAKYVLAGNIPQCYHDLSTCSFKDGVIVSSALLLASSIPIIIFNILTIIGAVKALAAGD